MRKLSFVAVAVLLSALGSNAIRAQTAVSGITITFQDLSETPTMSVTGATSARSVTLGGCNNPFSWIGGVPASELCIIQVSSTDGAVITSPEFDVNISDPAPNSGVVSDNIHDLNLSVGGSSASSTYLVNFFSVPDPGSPLGNTCAIVTDTVGCALTEDGTVQIASTVTWSDGAVDTIQFQSADSPTPEPSSLILLGTGVLGLIGAARRKWLA